MDVTFAKFFGHSENNALGELSKGPMIGFSPILDLELSKKMQTVALKNKIAHQLEIMNGHTSTDADKLTLLNQGIKTCLCSVPIKYMHSPVEIVDLIDIQNCSNLIAKFVETI